MKEFNYNKWATFRRKMLDALQENYRHLYSGVVLDIGGRDRGRFKKPKNEVENWIYADINAKHKPDIVLNVSDMKQIDTKSIDVVNAIELFEHVKQIKEGLKECYRVLKNNGVLIISVPFLFPIHADPFDFQRWTSYKWRIELENIGFKIEKIIIMGLYYNHLADILKFKLRRIEINHPVLGKLLYRITSPYLTFLSKLDYKPTVRNDPVLKNFHNGYFIIAKKEVNNYLIEK